MEFPNHLENLHEGQTMEFKEAAGGLPRDIWETYSAFANTEGGEIVLGVKEEPPRHFEVVGVPDPPAVISQFWTELRNSQIVERDVMLADGVRRVTVGECEVIVITVPRAERSEKPVRVYCKKEKAHVAYVRRGEDDLRATDSDIRLMTYDGVSHADRRPLPDLGMEHFDPDTIRRYRQIFSVAKSKSPWNGDSDEDFLFHIGALSRWREGSFRATTAGLLAFGREYEITSIYPHYLLDYRRETSGSLRWDDRVVSCGGEWSGNLVDFYLEVSSRIAANLDAPFSTDDRGMLHGSRNPVVESVNEALVNALVHAYYGSTGGVSVVLRKDSVVVRNPGGFLIDRKVAIAGGTSEARNPTLMKIFALMGASDRAGSGMCEIWLTWLNEFGREPMVCEGHAPATVELSLPLIRKASSGGADGKVASYVRESGVATAKEVAEGLGIEVRSAQRRLASLYKSGILVRERSGKAWAYRPSS